MNGSDETWTCNSFCIEDTFDKPVNFDINMDCQDIKDAPKNDELKQQNNNNYTFENEEFF